MSEYLLTIPETVYQRARQIARQTAQTVDQVMLSHLETLPTALPGLTPDEEAELEALHHLSDDALWTIAREQLPEPVQAHFEQLMMQNSKGKISADGRNDLARLVERGERLMLRKSEAIAILSQRGYKVDREELSKRD